MLARFFVTIMLKHTLHHVIKRLGMHHIIEVISHLDRTVLAQISVGLSLSQLVMTGKGSNKGHDILCYVFCAKYHLSLIKLSWGQKNKLLDKFQSIFKKI